MCMDTSKKKPIETPLFSLTSHLTNSESSAIGFVGSDVLRLARTITPARWKSVQVEYSNTKAGDVGSLSMVNGCASSDELNYHFVICNGLGKTQDGLIQPTYRWQQQRPCISDQSWNGDPGIIRVCVIGTDDSKTEMQDKSIGNLISGLASNFNVAK